MAGLGPDLINASLGAAFGGVVGPLIDNVVKGLKFVSRCKEQCTALREDLEKIEPLLASICEQCEANPAMKKWLEAFEKCVREAEKIMAICSDNSSGMWDRAYEVKYGGEVLNVRKKIRENVSVAPMALLSRQSGSMSRPCTRAAGMLQPVPDKILGMEDHFTRVRSSILEGHASESSSCVAIQGMGGAGKTLLAQMVNNDKEIQDVFGKECILWITVGRDASVPNIYVRMGKHLGVDIERESALDDQRTHLMNEFASRRVLLILDDVWDGACVETKEVVEWLNIARGAGSVTVVTTRTESIARRIDARVEVILLLTEALSWELFSTHAFGTDPPAVGEELEALAKAVCKECKCLPLALKVVGLAMRGNREIVEWKGALQHLQASTIVNRSVEEQLFRRLQMSYDQLEEATKICFLYFAAFPEDYEIPVERLRRMWVVEGIFGGGLNEKEAMVEAQCALKELRRRSLIVDCRSDANGNYQCVKMHDILRDLAIHLTREGEVYAQECLFYLETKYLEEFPSGWLKAALKVERMSLWGKNIRRFPSGIRAPHLKVCMLHPHIDEFLSAGYDDRNFGECIIEENFFSNVNDLRYLMIGANKTLTKLPISIGGLEFLQHLNLSLCRSLKELPTSIGRLGFLQYLDLSNCGALMRLPESMGELGSLQHLNLNYCRILKRLPESMGGLGSLQHLSLRNCGALKKLPENMGGLGSLQYLNLYYCNTLKELPASMGRLRSLQHLDLSYCRTLKDLPKSMGGLKSLQHIDLCYCGALKKLPESMEKMGFLQHLDLNSCLFLKELPKSMGELGSLQHLDLSGCHALKELPENMGRLGFLQHLNLTYCDVLEELPESMGGLESLQHLNLQWCSALKELPKSMGGLGSLQHLNLSYCVALKGLLENMGGLGSLQHLNLSYCDALKELPESMGRLGSLQHLDLSYCDALKELPQSMGGLGSLQHLNLSYCVALKGLPENMGGLGSLQHLNLSYCDALKELPESMGRLGSLQHLDLSYCDALKELPQSMGGLGSLQHLDLTCCDALKEFPLFVKIPYLHILC